MNCRPGDLARIVGVHPLLSITDRIVRLKHEPPVYIGSDAYWHIDRTLTLLATADFRDARGVHVAAGTVARTDKIADEHLRPIRGDGVTDDEVRELYTPSHDEVPS